METGKEVIVFTMGGPSAAAKTGKEVIVFTVGAERCS